jgi:hypothetical protein
MKTLFVAIAIAVACGNVVAATKCVPDGRGGMCCWDTVRDGPFRPLGC